MGPHKGARTRHTTHDMRATTDRARTRTDDTGALGHACGVLQRRHLQEIYHSMQSGAADRGTRRAQPLHTRTRTTAATRGFKRP